MYTLLFADTGLSIAQISSLLGAWSLATLVLEVPSGALADSTSRRRLLVVGPLLTAVAFGLWVSIPGYWIFLVGFVLWGLKTALVSGALEALVYEELQRCGAADRYAAVTGRAEVVAIVAVMCSGAVAAPVLAAGGYVGVGVASIAVYLLAALTALLFPEHRNTCDDADDLGWTEALRAGVEEVRRAPRVRAAVVLVVAVTAVWGALDEYTPLLIRGFGVSDTDVSLLMVVVWSGAAVGGLVAGRLWRIGNRSFAVLIACGGASLGVSALWGHPAAVVGLSLGFGLLQVATVVADSRLQHSIEGSARATVTSFAGMSTDLVMVGVYGVYAAAAVGGHATAFAVLMVPYLVTAAWLGLRRRSAVG